MATVIYNLLGIFATTEHQQMQLIRELNHHHHFDHNIFLLSSNTDADQYLNARRDEDSIPYSVYVYTTTGDQINGLDKLMSPIFASPSNEYGYQYSDDIVAMRSSRNLLMIVVSDNEAFDKNVNFLTKIKRIQLARNRMKIGIFFRRAVPTKNLKKHFEWFWSEGIVNVFIAAPYSKSLNLFIYNPFGHFDVINVTYTINAPYEQQFFLRSDTNFQQEEVLIGTSSYFKDKLWPTVFKIMNCSSIWSANVDANISEPIKKKGLYVIPALATLTHPKHAHTLNIYPVTWEVQALMVPEARPYPEFSAYLRAMTSNNFFIYSSTTVILMTILLITIRYYKNGKLELFRSITDVANLLMNDNGAIKYPLLHTEETWLLIPWTFVGFIFVSGILSNLQQHLVRPILQPQIDTVDEFYRSPLKISTIHNAKALGQIYSKEYSADWTNKFTQLPHNEFYHRMDTFSSMSIFYDSALDAMLLRAQKRLNIYGYHLSKIENFGYPRNYWVYDTCPFFSDRVNEILQRTKSAGLHDWWLEEWRQLMVKGIVNDNRNLMNSEQSKERMEIEQFSIPMFIVYGWGLSVIIFVIEIVWMYLCRFQAKCKFKQMCKMGNKFKRIYKMKNYFKQMCKLRNRSK